MKNTFKNNVESLGLSYQKTITYFALINVVGLMASFVPFLLLKKLPFLFIGLGITLFIDFYFINIYSVKVEQQEKDHENEFVVLISYFQIFIANNKNVYNAFQAILPYGSNWSQNKIQQFIDEIDHDKSVQPFINFANNYKTKIVQSVMLSIYQMIEQGENNYQVSQFTILFDNLNREKKLLMMSNKQRALEGMNIFPLFGAGFMTLLLTFALLLNVGDIIRGF